MGPPQTTKRSIKIAICQFDVHPPPNRSTSSFMRPPKISFDRERIGSEEDDHQIKNFESAKRFIIRAASEGARLIIFPEYFITGMIVNHLHLASKEFEWIKKFQTLAIENRIDIIPGTIVEEVVGDGLPLPTPALDQQRSLFNSYVPILIIFIRALALEPKTNQTRPPKKKTITRVLGTGLLFFDLQIEFMRHDIHTPSIHPRGFNRTS